MGAGPFLLEDAFSNPLCSWGPTQTCSWHMRRHLDQWHPLSGGKVVTEVQLRRKNWYVGGKNIPLSSLYPSCRFETEEEAIAVANATPFGLAGQVLNALAVPW